MKIDNIKMEDIQVITDNYDNLEILKICKHLINVVINDIEDMNETLDTDIEDLILGNNNYIKRENLESLVSIVDDTITDIENYNKEVIS